MENKDEVLDEIDDVSSDISEVSDIKPSVSLKNNEDTLLNDKEEESDKDTLVMEDVKTDDKEGIIEDELDLNIDNVPTEPVKTVNKAPIIIVLSFLLVLDLAALIIYLIGVDKVIQFLM